MVSEIRLYIEGDKCLKEGFSYFFRDLIMSARARKIEWDIVLCGPRSRAFRSFKNALIDHPNAFNLLLVDSEAPVTLTPWEHLRQRLGDEWERPENVDDKNCHMMVQTMEAWFVADISALKSFYKNQINENALPKTVNGRVEQIVKATLEPALKAATADSSKGKYHKTGHAPGILKCLTPAIVRAASPQHCDRLFKILSETIDPLVAEAIEENNQNTTDAEGSIGSSSA